MNLAESISYIKENDCLAAYFNEKTKELFIIEYTTDPESISDVIVFYANNNSEEDTMSLEEFRDQYTNTDEFNFFPIKKKGIVALDLVYPYIKESLEENKLEYVI